ncbi:MAG TPA: hypothetical protein VJO99_09140 [Burkholderiaceae bacterium]|nr:hypothetical protein [Burkholderiaceae bacterium]
MMHNSRKLSAASLLTATTFSTLAQQASAPTPASAPPGDNGRIIDPTFFVALVIALIVGVFIGRLTVRNRVAH